MAVDLQAVFKATADCQERMQTARLRNVEWSALFSCNGERSLHEIGRFLDVSEFEIKAIAENLTRQGLIEETAISMEQYVRNTGRGPEADRATSLQEFLRGGRPEASEPAPQMPAAPAPPPARKLPPVPAQHAPSPSAPPPVAAPRRALRLKALIDFIVSRFASSTEGQLAVYRTLLRVPPELLKRAGIVSLQLVDDETIVDDLELQQAITSAVAKVLSVKLPESVLG
jgi:hypothetical protein